MIKLSSIIIAKNEETNIRKCIESQLECIDEIIIIIDSKTTDNTKEIALEFEKVKIEISEWLGYSKTKQYAISKTSNDWVLWIDADEEITQELNEELIEFKKQETEYSAYQVARRAFFLNKWIKHSGWYPGYVTRLFNKNKANFIEKEVHEHLIVDGKIGKLNNDLNHFTDPNINHYFEKFNRYTSLAAFELFNKNKNATLSDILARPLFLFLKMYIFRKGFLDGFHGLILALFSAFYVFVKYSKLWEKQNSSN